MSTNVGVQSAARSDKLFFKTPKRRGKQVHGTKRSEKNIGRLAHRLRRRSLRSGWKRRRDIEGDARRTADTGLPRRAGSTGRTMLAERVRSVGMHVRGRRRAV